MQVAMLGPHTAWSGINALTNRVLKFRPEEFRDIFLSLDKGCLSGVELNLKFNIVITGFFSKGVWN
ncbi:hypothetical protein NCG89_12095 [Spongiibacter taiwanensis]|uniref:hypothetical protein n=1 Tax=Spongiibacter taiwanensis TaxID=1748242 RepID=UPI0020350235|nr:hypothetical protein [Spongiibacter taiwanensis]USA42263.1 hypothetical protein NCG89_12095 [Spongiibacter taiwanensis]